MPTRPTHVIFDLDGTLLDSEPLYTEAAVRVCARHGATFTYAIKRAVMGGDSLRGATIVVETLGLPITPEAYLAEREVVLRSLLPTLAPIAHAPALLAGLRTCGVPMAIATSGHRAITEAKLAHQPFLRDVTVRVCGDDPRLVRGKPAPDIFLLAAEALGADPSRCVVLEDSVLGVRAAVAAGMTTVALVDPRYGFGEDEFAGAAQVVRGLDAITAASLGFD
ncbi:MAG: HAD-IA family hydrolase [Polyangiales bacterium]